MNNHEVCKRNEQPRDQTKVPKCYLYEKTHKELKSLFRHISVENKGQTSPTKMPNVDDTVALENTKVGIPICNGKSYRIENKKKLNQDASKNLMESARNVKKGFNELQLVVFETNVHTLRADVATFVTKVAIY
uniref:Uncharacterized protein n=1 Tax=Romanomermis culicivorax TaxID=13658 RepID=A0A915J1Y5_ROMCU